MQIKKQNVNDIVNVTKKMSLHKLINAQYLESSICCEYFMVYELFLSDLIQYLPFMCIHYVHFFMKVTKYNIYRVVAALDYNRKWYC